MASRGGLGSYCPLRLQQGLQVTSQGITGPGKLEIVNQVIFVVNCCLPLLVWAFFFSRQEAPFSVATRAEGQYRYHFNTWDLEFMLSFRLLKSGLRLPVLNRFLESANLSPNSSQHTSKLLGSRVSCLNAPDPTKPHSLPIGP